MPLGGGGSSGEAKEVYIYVVQMDRMNGVINGTSRM